MKQVKFGVLLLMICCAFAQAQFLPDNKTLNVQAVQRWMDSNRDLSPIVQLVDEMYPSDAEVKIFDSLPLAEQDQKINHFLQQKNMFEKAEAIRARHGWQSVGEYMRLSTRLGNAIAAYFLLGSMENVTPEQKKALRGKADPAVLAVSSRDIAFVKANEKLLQEYIKAYSQGR